MIALPLQQSNIIPFPTCEAIPSEKSDEWYTQSRYIEAARKVMGSIDLDPASCELANETVKAKKYFTKEDDGLMQSWHDNIWLNPPFRRRADTYRSTIELFTRKLIDEYESGNISQAILLCTLRTETPWFQLLWKYLVCFANHNVRFNRDYDTPGMPGRYTTGHMHGTIFVYLGTREQRFIDIFSQFGTIAKAIAGPRHETVQARLWGDA